MNIALGIVSCQHGRASRRRMISTNVTMIRVAVEEMSFSFPRLTAGLHVTLDPQVYRKAKISLGG